MAQGNETQGISWLGRLAAFWLVFLFAFILGIALYDREQWPYGLVQDLKAFLDGGDDEDLGVAAKLRNDLGGVPDRHTVVPREPFDRERPYRAVTGLALRDERRVPELFLGPGALPGYRLIHGTFAFEETLHGVVLLDPEGAVERVWPITQEDVSWFHRPDTNVVPHGMDITRDGSLFLAFDGGTSLRRLSWCGEPEWVVMGGFHHSVDLNSDGELWSWGQVENDAPFGSVMIRIDPVTGEVLRKIRLRQIIEANPDIDIFNIRQKDTNATSTYLKDPWHVNDLEALPSTLADAYPQFETGDLLASYRNLDLVFVMDPDTLRVKWWRQGLVRRQHDPDFNARGTISIYDNNMHRGLSRIVDLDPVSYEHVTVVPGRDHDFYSWRRGKHQELPDGGWLVTSTEQGRVFELGPEGALRFEFLNHYNDRKLLTLAEALWLPPDWFQGRPDCGARGARNADSG